jgi:hypothetical protein
VPNQTQNNTAQKNIMKPNAQTADILATLTARESAKTAAAKLSAATSHIDIISRLPSLTPADPSIIAAAQLARQASDANAASLAKRPKARRDYAAKVIKIAEEIGLRAARIGGDYSGDVSHLVKWGDAPNAHTTISQGDRYSRSCKYSKNDATHVVTLAPSGVVELVENEALRTASARDGLHLISLMDDGAAVWAKVSGKQLTSESGWIIGNGAMCYHSTASRAAAVAGYDKKLAIHNRQQAEQAERARAHRASPAGKAERRARLVARLCGGITATLADARALGYCTPGIEQFQRTHGIGDTATLPQLVKSGNPAAQRLALHIARQSKATAKATA